MLAQDMEIGKKYRSTAFKRPVELVRIDSIDSNGEASVTVKYYEKYYSDCSFRMEPMPEDVKKPKKVKKRKRKNYGQLLLNGILMVFQQEVLDYQRVLKYQKAFIPPMKRMDITKR